MAKLNINQGSKKIRVVVAMSGGVDSSVAAALFKKQGHEVAGVFMQFWSEGKGEGSGNLCCSEGAQKAARAVAAKLKIPFYVFNFEKEFKKAVVGYFLDEVKHGRTPNPCVVCNKKIKFGLLFDKALGLDADFLATGHYACLRREIQNPKGEIIYKLYKAKDEQKDQSYFLYQLNQRQLSQVVFPLENYTKDEVYKLAKKWRLPYRKEESFDLCFVANDTESFVRRHIKLKAGLISDLNGRVLGKHEGLALFTIGQRKSIPVAQGPWWVIKKDERQNILYVSNDEKDLYGKSLVAEKVNWLSGQAFKLPAKVWAKIRYKSEASEATIFNASQPPLKLRGGAGELFFRVVFRTSQRAITPGQSVVFYSKSGEVLGGGMIK